MVGLDPALQQQQIDRALAMGKWNGMRALKDDAAESYLIQIRSESSRSKKP